MEELASGEDSEKLVPLLDQLARVAVAQSRFDRAATLYQRAQSIIEAAQGKSAPALIPIQSPSAVRSVAPT